MESILTETIPIIAIVMALLYIFGTAYLSTYSSSSPRKSHYPNAWKYATLLCLLFTVWTVYTVSVEGLQGFWDLHTSSATGTQVWCDLLIAICIGWTWLAPKARLQGMNVVGWAFFVALTGCVGLSAMLARLLYLEETIGSEEERQALTI